MTGNQALIFFLPSITETMKSLPIEIRTLAAGLPYACSALGILLNGMWVHRTGQLALAYRDPDARHRSFAMPGGPLRHSRLADDGAVLPGWVHFASLPAGLLDPADRHCWGNPARQPP